MKALPVWRRFAFRLITVSSLLMAIAISASFWVTKHLAEKEFLEVLHEQFHDRFEDVESSLGEIGQQSILWSQHIVNMMSETKFAKKAKWGLEVQEILKGSGADVIIFVNNSYHVEIATDQFLQVGDDLSEWGVIRNALKTGESSIFIHSQFNRFFLFAVSPATKIKGAVLLGYELNENYLAHLKGSRNEELALIRRRAVMATTGFGGFSFDNLPLDYLRYQFLLQQSIPFERVVIDSVEYLVAGYPLTLMRPGVEGSVMVAFPATRMLEATKRINQQFLILFVAVFVILLALTGLYTFFTIGPIKQLISSTDMVALGDFNVQTSITSGDEFGLLGLRFNQMVSALRASRKDLEIHQLGLEETIQTRTKELQTSYLDLQVAHAHMKDAQDIANLGSWTFDLETEILSISKNFASLLGDESQVEIKKDAFLKMVSRADQEKVTKLFDGLEGEEYEEAEYLLYPTEKTPIYLLSRARKLDREGGTVFLGSALEITDMKLKEKDLTFARERAEKANELKNKLLSLLAHDLKGPVGGARNLITLVTTTAEPPISEDAEHLLSTADKALVQGLELVDEILSLKGKENTTFDIKSQWVKLFPMLEKLKEQLAGLLLAKNITMELTLPRRASVYGD
ncbi:MAG: HAMP domain-containing protein, partial [SAR324 cluster bacterium]|nr:HAMP domain-containing protein [SAR324 cluster bacterium]